MKVASRILGLTLALLMVGVMFGGLPSSAYAAKFDIGTTVEVYNTGDDGLYVRDAPCGNVIGGKFDGEHGVVLDGPVFCDDYNRWLIHWSDGLEGWSAEDWLRERPTESDLTVTSVNAPTSAEPGGYIAVSWTVKNQGDAPSGSFSNRISLATTPWGTDISLGNFSMSSISPGSSASDAQVPKIPESVSPGYYYVTVYADTFQTISESNENNNINKAPSQINICEETIVETVSTPDTPGGPATGDTDTSYTYSTGGSSSSLGHSLEYRFDWGDGSYSDWLSETSASHSWISPDTYIVRAQARCATHTSVVSDWSSELTVDIPPPPEETTGTIGVTSDPSGASFALSGPTSYSGITPWIKTDAPAGEYTIIWDSISGYTTPPPETKPLTGGETTYFYGLYEVIVETVSTPDTPGGPATGDTDTSYTYSTGGSSSSLGHSLEYRFDWGDGSYSDWLSETSASHSWISPDTYIIRAQARCATHTSVVSDWSSELTVDIPPPPEETTGTIDVTSEPSGVSFILSGPTSYSGITPWIKTDAPAGEYTITWDSISGYKIPPPETKSLTEGGTIFLYGFYQSTALAESNHPYDNNYENTWIISEPGVALMRLHFTKIELALNDYIYILDKNNRELTYYCGTETTTTYEDKWTEWFAGDTLKVKLETNSSYTAYGFLVDKMETIVEAVSTPDTPGGPATGDTDTSYTYSTGGSSSSLGHSLEYRFDWGDGSYSDWSSETSASHSWISPDTYIIRAQARCATHTSVVSDWSSELTVDIILPPDQLLPAPSINSPGLLVAPGNVIDDLSPTFTWNVVADADYYGLYIRDVDADILVFNSQDGDGPVYGTSFNLPSGILEWGKRYRWNMNSHNNTGWGANYSDRHYFTTPETPPTITSQQKQQEILNIVNNHRGSIPPELVLAIIRQEGGAGAFHVDGWNYNEFYSESDGPWAQPNNNDDGIMQVTSASGYHQDSGEYTSDQSGYDHSINDGCNYLLDNYNSYGSYVQATLHYNTGPSSLYIYLGLNAGDRDYLSRVAGHLDNFVPNTNTYGLQNQELVSALNQGQNILDNYLDNMGITTGQPATYYQTYQARLDSDLHNIGTSYPIVESFNVQPNSITQGEQFTISYTVSDTGGSGLKQVELWRGDDDNGTAVWPQVPAQTVHISGSRHTGQFQDPPPLSGSYWYGIHVVDNNDLWNDEGNSHSGHSPGVYGPIKVDVTLANDAYWLATMLMSEASVGERPERVAVGWTALNRLNDGGLADSIEAIVKRWYVCNQEPTEEIIALAKELLEGKTPDPTMGATHFFSPRSMPWEGDEQGPIGRLGDTLFENYDTDGGLHEVPGIFKRVYFPSWTKTLNWCGDLSNVRRDYFMFYRPIISQLPAKPVIVSPLKINPEKEDYHVGDVLTAEFIIKNEGTAPITFDVLTVDGRFNDGKLSNGEYPDFTWERNITLSQGDRNRYQGSLTLSEVGEYHFFCIYRAPDGNWNTRIPTEGGVTSVLDITVNPPPSPPPELDSLAESHHPYDNNDENTWIISEPGVTLMRLHFTKIELAFNDYIYILDKNNRELTYYCGTEATTTYEEKWTEWFTGDTLKVKLKTNDSYTAYGFLVDKMETIVETVSTPDTPGGTTTGTAGTSYTYSTGGSSSSLGHSLEYRFDWGDNSYSGWLSSTSTSHSWSSGTYIVRVQARCAAHTSVVSDWSTGKSVSISPPTPQQPEVVIIIEPQQLEIPPETEKQEPPGSEIEVPALVESRHPYDNNYEHARIISEPGVEWIKIHFAKIELALNDYIYILDKDNRELTHYRGTALITTYENTWTEQFPGDTLNIKLKTNSSCTAYGFLVDKIDTGPIRPPNRPPTVCIDSVSPDQAGQGQMISFSGHGTDPEGPVVNYSWRSSIDGQLSTLSSFSKSDLSVGTHTIYFKVEDNDRLWSEEVSATVIIDQINHPYVQLYGQCTDVKVGEEVILNLSIVNPITSPDTLTVQLTLCIPSGWSVTSGGFGPVVGGMQTALYEIEPGPNTRTIWLHIKANEPCEGEVIGNIDYCFAGETEDTYHKEATLSVRAEDQSPTGPIPPEPEPKPDGFLSCSGPAEGAPPPSSAELLIGWGGMGLCLVTGCWRIWIRRKK